VLFVIVPCCSFDLLFMELFSEADDGSPEGSFLPSFKKVMLVFEDLSSGMISPIFLL